MILTKITPKTHFLISFLFALIHGSHLKMLIPELKSPIVTKCLESYLAWINKQILLLPFFIFHATHEKKDEEVVLEVSLDFKQNGPNKRYRVLHHKTNIFCLDQSCFIFWKYLTEVVGCCFQHQGPVVPCHFICKKVILLCYSSGLISWWKMICLSFIWLPRAIGSHGSKTGFLKMIQNRHIKHVLDFFPHTCHGGILLPKCAWIACHWQFQLQKWCRKAILSTHLSWLCCTDCAAWYMIYPMLVHEHTLMRVGCCLKAAVDKLSGKCPGLFNDMDMAKCL